MSKEFLEKLKTNRPLYKCSRRVIIYDFCKMLQIFYFFNSFDLFTKNLFISYESIISIVKIKVFAFLKNNICKTILQKSTS